MSRFGTLSDADLHLYLAGALPAGKRLLLAWALLLDGELRSRVDALRRAGAMHAAELAPLRERLFPPVAGGERASSPATGPVRASRPRSRPEPRPGRPPGPARRGLALAGALAALALCAAPWILPVRRGGEPPDVIAKGRGLGVTLYVKGDSAFRVENHAARVAPTDTLQAVPLGTSPQHLALLGWDAGQGLVRLFPTEGGRSRQVSAAAPPPALLLQGMEENRLICVTSTAPFRLADAEALLRQGPYRSMDKAPAVRLEGGLYVQVFAIAKVRGGRI